jgi:ABC-type uncharacterized transport system substrate-binding protein
MCKVGKFYIYKETINDNCWNDKHRVTLKKIFATVIKNDHTTPQYWTHPHAFS